MHNGGLFDIFYYLRCVNFLTMRSILIFLSLTLVSCGTKYSEKPSPAKGITQENDVIKKDTVIAYSIDGISSEGAEAKVTYKKKKIYESKINIYGETGQAEIVYRFSPRNIEVVENNYKYKKDLKNVRNEDDLVLSNTVKYYIDHTGKVLSDKPKEYIDIFKEFKETVPFELK